jgi:hypothetical protein
VVSSQLERQLPVMTAERKLAEANRTTAGKALSGLATGAKAVGMKMVDDLGGKAFKDIKGLFTPDEKKVKEAEDELRRKKLAAQ